MLIIGYSARPRKRSSATAQPYSIEKTVKVAASITRWIMPERKGNCGATLQLLKN
jgi:hypothetical protein